MFMFEKAVVGSRRYWLWLAVLAAVIALGFIAWFRQLTYGLAITGMSRDVSWGLYIAQFTFLVGVAASAVMVVLPYYLHNWKVFGKVTILGELLAVSAVTMCMLFIFVDMGQPMRVLNVLLYPTLNSLMFWDMVSLSGYLFLNALISIVTLSAERKMVPPPKWIKPIIVLSIPWAVSIHTVTAFLYAGLPGRPMWMTAVLAPRFLASAFAAGPALLILLALAARRLMNFDVGREAVHKLSIIVTYAMSINVFLILMELFTGLYSGMPEHKYPIQYLFTGLSGHATLVPWMWTSILLAAVSLVLLLTPKFRNNGKILPVACIVVFLSLWIDKGVCLIISGFVPSPLAAVTDYAPTLPEMAISVAIWALGAFMVTVFYKIAISVRQSLAQ
jgi:Ni/Fe-hydrogenase subunit HybB-like protein